MTCKEEKTLYNVSEGNTKFELPFLLMFGIIGLVMSILSFIDGVSSGSLWYLSAYYWVAYLIWGLIGAIIVFRWLRAKRSKQKIATAMYALVFTGSLLIYSIIIVSWIQFNTRPLMLQESMSTFLCGILMGAIIIIVGLRLKKKYQIPWSTKEAPTKGAKGTMMFSIIAGTGFVLVPILLALIKPSLKEVLIMLPISEMTGSMLIIIGLRLKKKYNFTFSKK